MLDKLRLGVVVVMALGGVAAASPSVKLAGQHPRWANPANDRGVVADQHVGHMTVRLARSAEKQHAFDALLEAQQTLGSPLYHQWLTPAQIGERFGASDADIAAVTSWLRAQGFTILRVGNGKSFVEIAGTTGIAAKAFGVEFHRYAVGGKTLVSIDREPTIPATLAPIIAGVRGLHQRDIRPQHTRAEIRSPIADSNGNHSVGVADFATIYDLGPVSQNLSGKGQVIGIIGRARVFPDDVTNFGTAMGITMPTPMVVIPSTGQDPGTPCGDVSCGTTDAFDDQEEATLDVLRAGSIAPGATVQLIVSLSDDMGDDGTDIAIEFAVDNFGTTSSANIINLSFGSCEAEDESGQSDATSLDTFYQQAAMQGQSVFVSAGDAGAAGCQPQGGVQDGGHTTAASINILASSGSVTCMGGTKFADADAQSTYWNGSGAALGYIPEGAWNEADVGDGVFRQLGGGGGESIYIAKPSFQSALSGTNRLVPDVSFDSATIEGYVVCLAGLGGDCAADTGFKYAVVGGTSAAAPDMSGVAALIDQSVGKTEGNLNPNLYMLGATPSNNVYNDVTVTSSGVTNCDVDTPSLCNNSDPGPDGLSGGTVGFQVEDGYDEATGWGSIDITQLVAHWPGAAPLPLLSINPTSITVFEGQTGTVALTPSGFNGTPTFSCSHGLPSNATCTFAGTTLTISVAHGAAGVTDDSSRGRWVLLPLGFALLALMRLRRRTRRFAAVFTVFAITTLVSCGNSSNGQIDAAHVADAPPPVTSVVTITANAGSASASAMLSLTSN